MRRRDLRLLALLLAALTLGLTSAEAQPGASNDTFVPVTDAMLQTPAPEDWLIWRRTLDGWGYSPLDQIDKNNVSDLRMVWTRAMNRGNQQGNPLATRACSICRTRTTSSTRSMRRAAT